MYFGLTDHIVDRITATACLIALASGAMLWHDGIYPISMIADLSTGCVLAIVYFLRNKTSSNQRMVVIASAGLLVGFTAIFQTSLFVANGFLVIGCVMALSFTSWSGWRAWLLPMFSVTFVLCLAVGIIMGWINMAHTAAPVVNSVAVWLITAMCVALLALVIGSTIGDLKRKLLDQMDVLIQTNRKLFLSANTDTTTGLVNQRRLEEVVNAALQKRIGGCLLVINLSNFRLFNALHGQTRGDETLMHISVLLSELAIANKDLCVASLPGAQFGIWMPEHDVVGAIQFHERFSAQFRHEAESLNGLSTYAGLAEVNKDGVTFNRLIQKTAVALSDAKTRSDFSCSLFSPAMALNIENTNALKLKIRSALNSDGFYPVYQTKVNSRSNHICGLEGLARMKPNGTETAPGPGEFIPVIHNEGWMIEFGALMLNAILKDVPRLVTMYGPETKVSVNISPPLYLAPEFLQMLVDGLLLSNADPRNVVIEITEEVFASSLEDIISVTNEIRKLGVDVSLDDFGTGFSSLSYLKAVDFDEIKIDRSFVHQIEQDSKSNILLSAIIELGMALGSRMVIEGVETKTQLDIVNGAGCEIIQGFYYSKPDAIDRLVQLNGMNALEKSGELQKITHDQPYSDWQP